VRTAYSGDAAGLQRIFSFLDHWGLINYEAADGASTENASSDAAPFAVAPACKLRCSLSSALDDLIFPPSGRAW
jgi:hypothetical protein